MNALRLPAETRPKNHVRLPVENRLNEKGNVPRVILQVGILDNDNLTRNVRDAPCAMMRPFPDCASVEMSERSLR